MKKRSVTLNGHRTSILLEPEFWDAIERAARTRAVSLSRLIAEIDAGRVKNESAEGLASALRVFALKESSGARGEAD
ncbi:MAG TPA: aryl-sulfate sulfotransferase [Parvularcula sp.]|nr:aryl-sulfate sulfotransferase [Parvularcula sp.]HBS32184.1 aryl-sulfate sulfotransferase [Parvularcula sp.]